MIRHGLLLALGLLLAGCSVLQSEQGSGPIPRQTQLAVVPLLNLSQTPQAGEQAASMLSAILRARGVEKARLYLPADDSGDSLFGGQARLEEAMQQARAGGASHVVTGTVDEWRYKSGLDGEPAVGVTLEVRRLADGRVVWTGTAARTGWGREGLSVAGHKVLDKLVAAMPLTDGTR